MARTGYLGQLVRRVGSEAPTLAPAPPLLRRWEALQSLEAGALTGPAPPESSRLSFEPRVPTAGPPPRAPGAERPRQTEAARTAQPAGGTEMPAPEADDAAVPSPPVDRSRQAPGRPSLSGHGEERLPPQRPAGRVMGEVASLPVTRDAPSQRASLAPPSVPGQPGMDPAAGADAGRMGAATRSGPPPTGALGRGVRAPGSEPGDPSATGGTASLAVRGGEISRPWTAADRPPTADARLPEGTPSERGRQTSPGVAGPGSADAGAGGGGWRSAVALLPPAPALSPAGTGGRGQETGGRSQSPEIQIGTLDIHVEAPRDAPPPEKPRVAPRPATALSRGLTSAYGLRQG